MSVKHLIEAAQNSRPADFEEIFKEEMSIKLSDYLQKLSLNEASVEKEEDSEEDSDDELEEEDEEDSEED